MQVSDLQQQGADFVRRNNLRASLSHRLLDLSSELGELCKEILQGSDYGRQPFETTRAWEQEMGDLFFSPLCVANSSGVDLDTASRIGRSSINNAFWITVSQALALDASE